MRSLFIFGFSCLLYTVAQAQRRPVAAGKLVTIEWPAGWAGRQAVTGRMVLDPEPGKPLFRTVGLVEGGRLQESLRLADPVFRLSVGTRDLVSQNGWNIFFDKVPLKPYRTFTVQMEKDSISVRRLGARTLVRIGALRAGEFRGWLEIIIFHGSPLFNVAAVMQTERDSTAILYDAGLVSGERNWDSVCFYGVDEVVVRRAVGMDDPLIKQAVKYRAIAGERKAGGSLVVFPPPHQYFYPLDEAFNLQFTWYGRNADDVERWPYGLGIRQDPQGDHRYVPWFNAPPGTRQRLNFFCLLGRGGGRNALDAVRAYTHDDRYLPLDGYKTMSSHYHNEFVTKGGLKEKGGRERPAYVGVFERAGVDIVHLAEFHGVGHPRGPDTSRLRELDALFSMCRLLSTDRFLLLPGEEPNEFFGGHWLALFPRPVYWVMSRKKDEAYESKDPLYGKVYRVGDAREMLDLLEREGGLAWTAHPRTKGSTGFPDRYKDAGYFLSDRFLGGAWKAMPADLSQARLGKRVLDLMDDMNNWGLSKRVLAEADLFSIEPANEMYAHMNVNYLRLGKLPAFGEGWGSILDTLQRGKFFSTTGEVLIPDFTIDGVAPGDTVRGETGAVRAGGKTARSGGKATVKFTVRWTFPLEFAEIISGDGQHVYRHRIDLNDTRSFGRKDFQVVLDLSGRKWARLEVWDAAVNGAFTQTVRIE